MLFGPGKDGSSNLALNFSPIMSGNSVFNKVGEMSPGQILPGQMLPGQMSLLSNFNS